MATVDETDKLTEEQKQAYLDEWLQRLNALIDDVETWAKELGWATRRIEKTMKDSRLGRYQAPVLRFQEDLAQFLLEPIGRFAPRCEGVVDLYLMPAYDDVANLYYDEGAWNLDYVFSGQPSTPSLKKNKTQRFTKEVLLRVVNEMVQYAAQNG